MLGLTPKVSAMSQPYYVLVRYHFDTQEGYDSPLYNIISWLKYRRVKILSNTFGVHSESPRIHFHLHCIVQFPQNPLSNPLATLKRDILTKKFIPMYKHIGEQDFIRPRCIGISITKRETLDPNYTELHYMPALRSDEDKKVLGYPLKEYEKISDIPYKNIPNNEMQINRLADIEDLRIQANLIYKDSKKIRIIKDKVERKSENIWVDINTILDKHNPSSAKVACRILLEYYKNKPNRPPFPSHLAKLSELYCYKKGITDVEDILMSLFNY